MTSTASPVDHMQNAWRKRIHPRRGCPSAGFTKVKLDKKASAKLIAHLKALRHGLRIESERSDVLLRAIDEQIAGTR